MYKPWTPEEHARFAKAAHAPTPREQELESQNKALWELVGECERVLLQSGKAIVAAFEDGEAYAHDNTDLSAEAITNKWCEQKNIVLAAIQKAKEAK